MIEATYAKNRERGGSLYQLVYLGVRDDIPPGECTVDQLKYKAESAAA
jgi:bifunctional non-homologous end joining protein LigD